MKSSFIQSFREIDRRFALVLLADIAFYAALTLAIILSLKIAAIGLSAFSQIPAEMLDITKISDMTQLDTGLDETIQLLNKFKSSIALSIITFLALLTVIFTIFKGAAWAVVTKQKISKKYFMQFFKLTLCLLGSTALLILLAFWATTPAATGLATWILTAIAAYIIPISYAAFKPGKTIKENLKQTWHASIERFYCFLLPMTAAGLLLVLAMWMLGILLLFIPQQAVLALMLAASILWQSWTKYYIYIIARGIK